MLRPRRLYLHLPVWPLILLFGHPVAALGKQPVPTGKAAPAPQAAPASKGAPPAKPGPAKVILRRWNGIGNKLIAMAQDFPEDKYDYRPNANVRTFAEQLLHTAGSNYYAFDSEHANEDPPRATYRTKADVVAFVKRAVADGAAAIEKAGDAGVVENLGAWTGIIEHMGEHYGQLVVYYRNNGMVPPASRPPNQ